MELFNNQNLSGFQFILVCQRLINRIFPTVLGFFFDNNYSFNCVHVRLSELNGIISLCDNSSFYSPVCRKSLRIALVLFDGESLLRLLSQLLVSY